MLHLLGFGVRASLCAAMLCGSLLGQAPAATADRKPASPAAVADYRRKLEEYTRLHDPYEGAASQYWSAIAEKRRLRLGERRAETPIALDDYVLTQPPIYSGPAKPIDPSAPETAAPEKPYVPVLADFIQSAADYFKFLPTRPRTEIEFKRAYVKVASSTGLTLDQVVRVYGFEAGGTGGYDVQAGLEQPRPDAQAVSTALGYNQLLTTNSIELLAEDGDRFVNALQAKAGTLEGPARAALEHKIDVLRRMVAFCRTVSDSWSAHERLANTLKGLGVHALNLDIDIGPLLQTQKLLDSIIYAQKKGFGRPLTAAELEMMNLTGDGNGFDMVTMPLAMRDKVPTANFFQPQGYFRNPVAIRNNTVAKLIAVTDAKMDREAKLQGARDMANVYVGARE
jgi:hypothetical protein